MMIHEKLMSGQFLLDLKNDHAVNLLHARAHPIHHSLHALHPQLHHHQHQQQHQLPSPPIPAAVKMDLYSAYAYQQHLQQQLISSASAMDGRMINTESPQHLAVTTPPMQVLDLSRRCDAMETPPRKTPSPYQSISSSFGTGSPAHSPPTNVQMPPLQQQSQKPLIPANLLYSAQAGQQPESLPLPGNLAALYPGLYYPSSIVAAHIKPETPDNPITPPLVAQSALSHTRQSSSSPIDVAAAPRANTNTLLQTFASAAAVAAAGSVTAIQNKTENADATPLSPVGIGDSTAKTTSAAPTTPTSSTSASAALAALEAKTTRPFKAFPRDPLVIAANFAATDVLLDNPRVERYTEYRKRVLEQIRNSNGGARTVTNPKMRRTNSRSGSVNDGCSSSNNNSENDDRSIAAEESSDCDSNAGNFEKTIGNNNTSSSSDTNATTTTAITSTATSIANGSLLGAGQVKDAAYYERRRKNNAAAKKSRDRRRIKEDEIAIRAAYLERQNIELLCQIDALKAQLAAFTSKVGA